MVGALGCLVVQLVVGVDLMEEQDLVGVNWAQVAASIRPMRQLRVVLEVGVQGELAMAVLVLLMLA